MQGHINQSVLKKVNCITKSVMFSQWFYFKENTLNQNQCSNINKSSLPNLREKMNHCKTKATQIKLRYKITVRQVFNKSMKKLFLTMATNPIKLKFTIHQINIKSDKVNSQNIYTIKK